MTNQEGKEGKENQHQAPPNSVSSLMMIVKMTLAQFQTSGVAAMSLGTGASKVMACVFKRQEELSKTDDSRRVLSEAIALASAEAGRLIPPSMCGVAPIGGGFILILVAIPESSADDCSSSISASIYTKDAGSGKITPEFSGKPTEAVMWAREQCLKGLGITEGGGEPGSDGAPTPEIPIRTMNVTSPDFAFGTEGAPPGEW